MVLKPQTAPPDLCPIQSLRRRRPDLFKAPACWKTQVSDIEQAIEQQSTGQARLIGHSAGNRPIHAISYGPFEPQNPQATISSAMASDRPEVFFDPARRTRPVLLLIGTIHGGETEGIALCTNLMQIMETGCDLLGREQQRLRELLGQVRLVMVPCLNPDGRDRAGVDHLIGAELDDLFLVQQGICLDGTPLRGRRVKEVQPIDPADMQFLGGYYTDAGVNLQHDDFFGPLLAPENQALQSLVRQELPDGFLTLHAHGGDPAFMGPDAYMSPGHQRWQCEAAAFVTAHLLSRQIPVQRPQQCVSPPWSFYFQTYFHHACGALPLLFELPHGLKQRPYTHQQLIDIGLGLMEGWVRFALHAGLRPPTCDLFGQVSPA